MAEYPIPPWLKGPPDLGEQYLQGARIGASIAGEQARLNMEAQRTSLQLAEEQRRLEVESARQQQQLEMNRAYHEQTALWRQGQLEEKKRAVDLATQNAARRYAAQQQYEKRITSGEDPSTVLMEMGPSLNLGGAGLATLAKKRVEPVWVPPDATTGAPGYIKSGEGGVHIPPSAHAQAGGLTERDLFNYYKQRAKELAESPFVKNPLPEKASKEYKERADAETKEYNDLQKKMQAMIKNIGKPNQQATIPGSAQFKGKPYPKRKEDLKDGEVYDTARGPAVYNAATGKLYPVSAAQTQASQMQDTEE